MLTKIAELQEGATGQGFYLCARKEERTTRNGDAFLILTLQDRTGTIKAKVFDEVARVRDEFGEEDFVKVEGACKPYQGVLELTIYRIRRVNPDQDRAAGFREDDLIPVAPRPLDEMWRELESHIAAVTDPGLRALLNRIVADHGERLRIWPAAQTVHHAYRGGLLEHLLSIARVALAIAPAYGANPDLLVAGAVLHDIGKVQEIDYDRAPSYSREGNLVGHIALGLMMVREASRGLDALAPAVRDQVEHLIASHHGTRDKGSPIEPITIEAIILSMVDDLDAKLHQVRKAIDEDDGDGEFTTYHKRLGRAFYKGTPADDRV